MNNTAIVTGSIAAIAQREGQSLAETFLNCDTVILVDCSASMEMHDSRGGKSRYDVALEELAELQKRLPGKLAVIAFSSDVLFCPGGQPPFLCGNTDLAKALRFAKVADVPGMRFVVISDGQPDSAQEALSVARSYTNRIDVVYCGPELVPTGRVFLEQLARAAGGQAVTADRVQRLAEKTATLLLGA